MLRSSYNRHMQSLFLIFLSIGLFTAPFLNFNLFFLSWFFFVPILYLIENNKISPSKLGLTFGTISLLIATYWMTATLLRLTGAGWGISIISHLLYCLYESSFYIIVFLFTSLSIRKASNIWLKYLCVIFLYIIFEENFPRIFPYKIGNTQILFSEMSQLISILGINIVSALVLTINIASYELAIKNNNKAAYIIITIFLFVLMMGSSIEKNTNKYHARGANIRVAILQPVSSLKKLIHLQDTINESSKIQDLTIWPESSLDKVIVKNKEDYINFQKKFARKFKINSEALLLGSITQNKQGYYNSALLINKESEITDIYSKNKLMIFGEYYPLRNLVAKIIPIYDSFISLDKGKIRPLILKKKTNIGVIICYEDLFEENSMKLTQMGSEILINLTNDKWYGDSLAPYQHLMLAIPRSIENKRFLIRSTYNGLSAIISPTGKILNKVETNVSGYLLDEVVLRKDKSFYTMNYANIKMIYYLIFAWLVLLFIKELRNK